MAPWKSSDGGAIHKVGSSFFAATGGVAVTAATNLRGVIIWTLNMDAVNATADLLVDGDVVWKSLLNRAWTAPHPLFVPAGKEISFSAGTGVKSMSYEIL